jgi:hypothetical protein
MYFFLGDILRKVIECADFVENYYPYVVYRINLFNFFPSSRAFFLYLYQYFEIDTCGV